MDIGTGVELEYSYGAGDGRTRSGVASMPKERSGGPRLDQSCDWEKYGYDTFLSCCLKVLTCVLLHPGQGYLHMSFGRRIPGCTFW